MRHPRQWHVGLLFLVLAATVVPSGSIGAGESAAPPLIFAGSGTNLPITRLLVEAFRQHHPEYLIEVPASLGSTGGIGATVEGAIALGLISRPLKSQEQALGLTSVSYARTAVDIPLSGTTRSPSWTSSTYTEARKPAGETAGRLLS